MDEFFEKPDIQDRLMYCITIRLAIGNRRYVLEPLKSIYNKESIAALASLISKTCVFDSKAFQKNINRELESLEMKDRVKLIARELDKHIEGTFEAQVFRLLSLLAPEEKHSESEWDGDISEGLRGFMVWPLTQFVEDRGIDHFEVSMNALYELTKRFTAEFAIRPFIHRYPEKTFEVLKNWRNDPSHHVRRLVSEGTRPNLPWGQKVQSINENLARGLKLITPLRLDNSEYVRRSVANHVNDISRIDEQLALKTLKIWSKESTPAFNKIVRHASRSLIKAGNPNAFELLGLKTPKINAQFRCDKKRIASGDNVNLILEISSLAKQKVLINYKVHFIKKTGRTSSKVFHFKELDLLNGQNLRLKKSISFRPVTTRTLYPGVHKIEIQVNGKIIASTDLMILPRT